jgi:hypothetical protein
VGGHYELGRGKGTGLSCFDANFATGAGRRGLALISGVKGDGETGATQRGQPQTGLRVDIC